MKITGRTVSLAIIAVCSLLIHSGCVSALVRPSNMVDLAEVVGAGETKTLRSGTPQGTGGGVYQVPDDRVLVITRVIIQPMNLGPGSHDLTLIQSDSALGDRIRQTWWVPKARPTEYDFTPGELISSGSILKVKNNSAGDDVAVMIYGYIAAVE